MDIILALIIVVLVFSSTALLMIRHGYLPSPRVIKSKETIEAIDVQEKHQNQESGIQLSKSFHFSPKTRTYAFVIGANSYAHPSLHQLDFIKDDAERVASVLKVHYSLQKLTLLTGRQAKKESILHEIKQTLKQATKDDNIFLYFAGHGFQAEKPGQTLTYFGTYDTDPLHLETTALSTKDFQEILSNEVLGRVLVVLDACHSASEFKQIKNTEFSELSKLFTIESNRAIITSRVFQEVKTYSAYKKYQRFFTKYLVEGLREGVSKPDSIIRVRDLYYYISEKLDEEDFDFKPTLYSSSGENFPLLEKKTSDRD